MKNGDQYIIQFKGLKEGIHDFKFIIGKPFFDEFPHLEVTDGKVIASVNLNRMAAFLDIEVTLTGSIEVNCDRCLGLFDLVIKYAGHLVVRFSEHEEEGDDELIFLHPEDHRLDLKHYFYECISVSLPYRKVHPDLPDGKPGCDPDMLAKLRAHLIAD